MLWIYFCQRWKEKHLAKKLFAKCQKKTLDNEASLPSVFLPSLFYLAFGQVSDKKHSTNHLALGKSRIRVVPSMYMHIYRPHHGGTGCPHSLPAYTCMHGPWVHVCTHACTLLASCGTCILMSLPLVATLRLGLRPHGMEQNWGEPRVHAISCALADTCYGMRSHVRREMAPREHLAHHCLLAYGRLSWNGFGSIWLHLSQAPKLMWHRSSFSTDEHHCA